MWFLEIGSVCYLASLWRFNQWWKKCVFLLNIILLYTFPIKKILSARFLLTLVTLIHNVWYNVSQHQLKIRSLNVCTQIFANNTKQRDINHSIIHLFFWFLDILTTWNRNSRHSAHYAATRQNRTCIQSMHVNTRCPITLTGTFDPT